jgi:hypothetical protein
MTDYDLWLVREPEEEVGDDPNNYDEMRKYEAE